MGSTDVDGYVLIGESSGSTLAEFDIIGHELGHYYLSPFLEYTLGSNASLQEGIADMIGVYVEEQEQSFVDWEVGDEVPFIVRDLENPTFDCFTDVATFEYNNRHNRSEPLGFWFYLVSTGTTFINAPALGTFETLRIILEALNHVDPLARLLTIQI